MEEVSSGARSSCIVDSPPSLISLGIVSAVQLQCRRINALDLLVLRPGTAQNSKL